jgi:hypothetical protein
MILCQLIGLVVLNLVDQNNADELDDDRDAFDLALIIQNVLFEHNDLLVFVPACKDGLESCFTRHQFRKLLLSVLLLFL